MKRDLVVYDSRDELNCFKDIEYDIHEIGRFVNGKILILANVGRWNGRFYSYKELDTLDEIFNLIDGECTISLGSYDMEMTDCHHDGTSYFIIREIKNDLEPAHEKKLFDKLYNNTLTKQDLSKYTRSLKNDMKSYYGWA